MERETTKSIYVKFPRQEGFVIYPVELRVNPVYPRHWDLYGSVDHYIEHSRYPKIAALKNNSSYGLRIYQLDSGTKERILRGGQTTRPERRVLADNNKAWFRTPGLPRSWGAPMILLYDPLARPSCDWSEPASLDTWYSQRVRPPSPPLLASERNYQRYLESKKKSDDMVTQWRTLWPQSPVPRCIASPIDIDAGGLANIPLPLEIVNYVPDNNNNPLQQLPLHIIEQQREFIFNVLNHRVCVLLLLNPARRLLNQYHHDLLQELGKRQKRARDFMAGQTTNIVIKTVNGERQQCDDAIDAEKRYVTDIPE